MKNTYVKIAGVINLVTALIHVVAGQIDLVNPLNISNLDTQQKAEWVGVWHIVTILLFFTSFLILKIAFATPNPSSINQLKPIAILYILIGLPFIISSVFYSVLAPQWILLMPIGILLLLGIRINHNMRKFIIFVNRILFFFHY